MRHQKRTEATIAPGIHHFDTGPFNWYIIEDEGRLTLVDAGFPGNYSVFTKGIASPPQIRRPGNVGANEVPEHLVAG